MGKDIKKNNSHHHIGFNLELSSIILRGMMSGLRSARRVIDMQIRLIRRLAGLDASNQRTTDQMKLFDFC